MGRPVYPYELGDPDFTWLISNFRDNNPEYSVVEDTCLPVVFIGDAYPIVEGEEKFVPDQFDGPPKELAEDLADTNPFEDEL